MDGQLEWRFIAHHRAPSSADGAIVGADLGVLEGLTGQNFVLMRSVSHSKEWIEMVSPAMIVD